MSTRWSAGNVRHICTKERTSPAPHTGLRHGWPRPTAHATSDPSTATCLTPRTPLLPTARPSARSQAVSTGGCCPIPGKLKRHRTRVRQEQRTMSCLLAKTRTALCRMSGSSTIACIPEQAYSGEACDAVQRAVQRVHCAVLCDTRSYLKVAKEYARGASLCVAATTPAS